MSLAVENILGIIDRDGEEGRLGHLKGHKKRRR